MNSCKTYTAIYFYCKRANPSHSMAQRVGGVYFLRSDTKLPLYDLTC